VKPGTEEGESLAEGYNSNARYYLQQAKKVHTSVKPTDDLEMVSNGIRGSTMFHSKGMQVQCSGLGPTNKNTLKKSLNSWQIFRLLKLLKTIFD
jgi:hypothetical protein